MYDQFLKSKKIAPLLKTFLCGLERETLRVDLNGMLSEKAHPTSLGSPLTHPHIRTDFGESQLEWNTPPMHAFGRVENFLRDLMSFTASSLKKELFWPFSMPCCLKEIAIANYGNSHQGIKNRCYREGLKYRYGMNLQMISGLHFNFSFPDSFWHLLYNYISPKQTLEEFKSEKYLHIIRNFLRNGWLLTYLFGSSPAMHSSYTPSIPTDFKTLSKETLYLPYATSIRMSHLGYYSRIQDQLSISFNDLNSYLNDLRLAITTPKEEYLSFPNQLNNHILQTENEHYTRIRPKGIMREGESPLQAIESGGIEYVEVRAIDLDPYHPLGMNRSHLSFLHLFLLYCLFKPSPKLQKKEQSCLTSNQDLVALKGREKGLKLKNGLFLEKAGQDILVEMKSLATLLGYEKTLSKQQEKIINPTRTPSSEILSDIKRAGGIEELGLTLAKKHHKTLSKRSIPLTRHKNFKKEVADSLIKNTRLETVSTVLLEGYEHLEISTQVVIREALKKSINVEVLDHGDNLLRLTKGSHTEYIKQATKTSKDSYIVPHLLENKEVTKQLLLEKGFNVPEGNLYLSAHEAIKENPLIDRCKVVVKPKSTNFGVGITFIEKGDHTRYKTAIKQAFNHDNSVIVETFFPGKEYRFLVINNRVIAIAYREPANIVGDGQKSIQELVQSKNTDPHFYRHPKTELRLGKEEKEVLQSQELTPKTILKKGKKVYLRHNSNISTGGDSIDMTDSVHDGYKKIATDATAALGAKICGVDIIISSPLKAPTKENYAIIELNYNPILSIHAFPYKGRPRNVAAPLLDLLFEV